MIIKETVVRHENRFGGKGSVEVHAALNGEEHFGGHGRLLATIIVHKDSSIGYHQHVGERETYYVLEGNGIFTRNGESYPIGPGEAGIMAPGDWHGIENTGDTDIKLVALVIKE